MTVFLLAVTLLLAGSGAAEAGPIAGVFAAVGGWFAGTFGAALGGFLFNMVGSLALSALSMALQKKPEQQQAGITTESTTAGGTIPQRLIFGRYATGGQMVAPMMTYETDSDPNEWLVYVISLADKPITGLVSLIIDGNPVTINGNPAASLHGDQRGAALNDAPAAQYSDKVWIRFHDGNQTTPDAYLRRVVGTYPERPWTADMVGYGVPYVVLTFRGNPEETTFKGFPSVKFVVDGHALRDPRTGTDVFTRNPAVIAYNILRGIDIPGGDRWGVGADGYITSKVIAAANLCDSLVPVNTGGTRPRYRAGLEISVADEPHQALLEILKAMGGDVADMGGTWLLTGGDPEAHVLSITDDDIIVTDSKSLRPYPGLDQTVNAIHASYPDQDAQWEAKEAVPLYTPAYEAADGGRRLIEEIDFPAVPYSRQVRALMREMLADHRRMRTHVITLPPDALGVNLTDHIAWTSEVNGYIGKLFKVVAKTVDPASLCVAFTITERDPSDYDYDPTSEGVLPDIPSPVPVVLPIVGVPDFNAIAAVYPGDNGSRPGITITWNPAVAAQGVFWEIRRVAGDVPVASGTERPAAGRKEVSEGIIRATAYAVRGLLVIPGRDTLPGPWVYVTTENIQLGWDDLTDDVRTDVGNLETWINGTGDLIRQVMDEVGYLRDDMVEGDTGAFNERQEIRADLDIVALNNATALNALVVRVTDTEAGIVTQSDAITAVEAKSDRATAGGLFRVSAEATPTGAQSRIGMRAEATADGETHSAALYIDAQTDGTSQVGVVANRFFVASADGPAATRAVPFVVDANGLHFDNAYLGNVIQSTNFVSGAGGAGWRIQRNGTAEFNNVIIRRQLAIASGSLAVPAWTGGLGGRSALVVTGVPMTAWAGTTKTYLAVGGMSGATVTADNATGNELWGWVATVLPLTQWSGAQMLRIGFELRTIGVTSVSEHTLNWRLYEVS